MPSLLRPAVLLDRDGTLIVDRDYPADPAGVALLPGAAGAIRRLNRAGIFVAIVTNQSGIGRGYFTEDDYRAVHRRVVDVLAAEGARIDAAYHCPLAPGDLDPDEMRKPGAGMFRLAAREHGLDLARSWLVGDRVRDVLAAPELGARAIRVRGPHTATEDASALPPLPLVDSLADAVELILAGGDRER